MTFTKDFFIKDTAKGLSYRTVVAGVACAALFSISLMGCANKTTQTATEQPHAESSAVTKENQPGPDSLTAKEAEKSHEMAMSISPTKTDPTDPAGIFFNDVANSLDMLDIKVGKIADDETNVNAKSFAGQAKGLYLEYKGKLNAYKVTNEFTESQKEIAERILKELNTCYTEYANYYQDMLDGKVSVPQSRGDNADENMEVINKLYNGQGNSHGDAGYRARVAAERALADFKATLNDK